MLNYRYIVIVCFLVWMTAEVVLTFIKRAPHKQAVDESSLHILWLTSGVTSAIGVTWAIYHNGQVGSSNLWINMISLMLLFIGVAIRYRAIYLLRHFFTVNVAIHEEHEIIQTGLYKYIRHPAYTGLLIAMYGGALFLANILSFLIIVIPISWAMLHRIRIEEKVLCEHFGSAYQEYMKKTCKLIPGLF